MRRKQIAIILVAFALSLPIACIYKKASKPNFDIKIVNMSSLNGDVISGLVNYLNFEIEMGFGSRGSRTISIADHYSFDIPSPSQNHFYLSQDKALLLHEIRTSLTNTSYDDNLAYINQIHDCINIDTFDCYKDAFLGITDDIFHSPNAVQEIRNHGLAASELISKLEYQEHGHFFTVIFIDNPIISDDTCSLSPDNILRGGIHLSAINRSSRVIVISTFPLLFNDPLFVKYGREATIPTETLIRFLSTYLLGQMYIIDLNLMVDYQNKFSIAFPPIQFKFSRWTDGKLVGYNYYSNISNRSYNSRQLPNP